MKKHSIVIWLLLAGCADRSIIRRPVGEFVIPAQEFSRSVKEGRAEEFTIFDYENGSHARGRLDEFAKSPNDVLPENPRLHLTDGDPRFLEKGLELRNSVQIPNPKIEEQLRNEIQSGSARGAFHPTMAQIAPNRPPGSSAPYISGQMRPNPSLWPDEGYGSSLFRDVRAFQPMDIVTILVNESSEGTKKAETDTETKFSLKAAIEKFFGVETKDWASNNTALDPADLINATTTSKFEGDGETTREGRLKAQISAVIMEVLPNDLLRIEGTKIISVNNEEEVMVISGLTRQRDITAKNQVDSSRIANMRIDFYGRGVVAENQSPGWLARIIRNIWPF